MLQGVDHQFGHDQAETDRRVGVDPALVRVHVERNLLGVADHRGPEALAQLDEVGAQLHLAQGGRRQLPLHRSDRHDPVMRVVQVHPHVLGPDVARALQQHAGDDLQAVGDPVLHLLQQDRLFAEQVVLEPFGCTGVGDIRNRQKNPHRLLIPIIELLRVQHQPPGRRVLARQIHLVGVDPGLAGQGRGQQRAQPGRLPLALAKSEHRPPGGLVGLDRKRLAERGAGRDHLEPAIEQKQRRIGRGDHGERQVQRDVRMRCRRNGGHDGSFRTDRRLAERKPYPANTGETTGRAFRRVGLSTLSNTFPRQSAAVFALARAYLMQI